MKDGFRSWMPLAGASLMVCSAAWAQTDAVEAPPSEIPIDPPELTFGLDDIEPGTLSTQSRNRRLIFSILFGAEYQPEYFGSEDYEVVPRFRPSFFSFSSPGLSIGDEADALDDDPNDLPLGFALGASFNFVSPRDSGDYDELEGLDDVDGSLEAGLLAGYAWQNAEVYGIARYGLTGHNSWVGELGANYVGRPSDGWTLRFGPRATFGAENYVDEYFSISEREAAKSTLDAYDPDPGLVSAGLEFIASYRVGDRWWLEGQVKWDRLVGDAADSPIVEEGSEDMFSVLIGVRRAFVWDF